MREWLRKLRKSKKLSEIETARLAGIAQPFYHNIEMGIKNPSVDTAKRIAANPCQYDTSKAEKAEKRRP